MTSFIFSPFTKVAFSDEDRPTCRHVIKFLRQNKYYGAKRFLKEFPHKSWPRGELDRIIVRKIDRTGTSKRLPGSGFRALLELLTKLKKLKHLL